MSIPAASSREPSVLDLERQLLRNLCHAGITSVSADERQRLADYSWQGQDHQTIFRALFRLANISSAALRHQLPAEAARMGFPDVSWEQYFQPPANDECNSHRTTSELIVELVARSKRTR